MVIIDWQHAGKPGKRITDRGAWGDLNRSGSFDNVAELETYWTGKLAFALFWSLYKHKIPTIQISDGFYRDRNQRAGIYANGDRAVYLALHFNALRGGLSTRSGTYGSIFYDHRSSATNGPVIAGMIAHNLMRECPELSEAKALAARPTGWTRRAFGCIKHCPGSVIGLVLEPAFIDRITLAIVTAIREYLK